MGEQYQVVTLVTDDGQRLHYTGKVQIDPERPIRVVDVWVSQPQDMPAGCSWGEDWPVSGGKK